MMAQPLKRFVLFFLVSLLFFTSPAVFSDSDDLELVIPDDLDSLLGESESLNYTIGGYFKNETAYRTDEPRSFTKIRNILSLNLRYVFSTEIKFYTSGWGYYDHVYGLFDYDTISARNIREEKEPLVFINQLEKEKDDRRLELREMYLDMYFDNLDIRIGKQHVVWGVLEGIRIVDEINPMDFRELITPDLLDYRIPLWTLKVNYYHKNTNYELLWIPELVFHQAAAPGSEWELFQELDSTTQPENFNPLFSELGLKITKDIFGAEVSFSYFYTWDDYPTTFRIISLDDVRSADPTTRLAIFPTYSRMHMFGTTATKEVRGNIIKAEFVFVTDKYFAIVDTYTDGFLDDDGDVKRNHIRWGLGYDFSFWGADFSPAIAQWIILDYEDFILSDQIDTTLNLFIRKPIQKYSAVLNLLIIQLINFKETYIKPRLAINLTDSFQINAGADIFIGRRTSFGRQADAGAEGGLVTPEQRAQFLGNFNENKRVSVGFKYTF